MYQAYTSTHPQRNGLSALELLTVLAVIGVLVSLLLPAVQHARAVSRVMECRNNLRQIGLAMHSHHEQTGRFPGLEHRQELLPFLEQTAVFELCRANQIVTDGVDLSFLARISAIADVSLPVYSCPSDPVQAEVRGRFSSYPMTNVARFVEGLEGMYPRMGTIAARDVTDGLSNTVSFSERLLVTFDELPSTAVRRSSMSVRQRLITPATTDAYWDGAQEREFTNACRTAEVSLPEPPSPPVYFLLSGDVNYGGYNHVMPPNHNSCWNGLLDESSRSITLGAVTATSLHRGGVNVLYADGSVRFESESIDGSIWSAIATRNGGEVVRDF